MNEQLLLEVQPRTDQSFDNFSVGDNSQLIEQLKLIDSVDPGIIIYSVAGQGKSHLLNALCYHYQNRFPEHRVAYLALSGQGEFPADALEGFEQCQLLCIDDIDKVFGNRDWEDALFRLLNAMSDLEHKLVLATSEPLSSRGPDFVDLGTRMARFIQFELQALDDNGQMDVFSERAKEKGMRLEPEVLKYIQTRGPRTMSARMTLLDQLDKKSLKAKRAITIPFLKEIVNW